MTTSCSEPRPGWVIDLFAGAGGASLGIHSAGATCVGIEWDADTCATRRAAGLDTVEADVASCDPADYAGAEGLWASPPCQAWSMAGKQAAKADQARLGRHIEQCRDSWQSYDPADYADSRTPLVLEPLRWVDALRPRWVACEQVPPVLDLWVHYADVLCGWGYSAWAGVINAADHGVPQTRRRAILLASRSGPAVPPEPTHAEHPKPGGLFGAERLLWVTMAQALGWGDTAPSPTMVTTRRSSEGRLVGRKLPDDEPSRNVGGWKFVAAGETGQGRPRDPETHPADAITTKGTATRRLDEPAPTLFFGGRGNDVSWVHQRPATSVCADPRVPEPGWRGNPADYADGNPTRSGDNAVRVTVQQAAILQGFPTD